MKSVPVLNFLVAILLVATAATGCKKNPKYITPIGSPKAGGIGNEPPGGVVTPGNGFGQDNPQGKPINPGDLAQPIEGIEDHKTFEAQTIYFEFDRSAIKASEQSKLDAVGTGFKSQPPNTQLRIEGNCDER